MRERKREREKEIECQSTVKLAEWRGEENGGKKVQVGENLGPFIYLRERLIHLQQPSNKRRACMSVRQTKPSSGNSKTKISNTFNGIAVARRPVFFFLCQGQKIASFFVPSNRRTRKHTKSIVAL